MYFRSVLLRLLLSLALVANGTTAAFANARMAFEMGTAPAVAEAQATGEERPCHDMTSMGGTTERGAMADHDSVPAAPGQDSCCQAGVCVCSCLAHLTAFLAVDALEVSARAATRPASTQKGLLENPVLRHLIRPPIG